MPCELRESTRDAQSCSLGIYFMGSGYGVKHGLHAPLRSSYTDGQGQRSVDGLPCPVQPGNNLTDLRAHVVQLVRRTELDKAIDQVVLEVVLNGSTAGVQPEQGVRTEPPPRIPQPGWEVSVRRRKPNLRGTRQFAVQFKHVAHAGVIKDLRKTVAVVLTRRCGECVSSPQPSHVEPAQRDVQVGDTRCLNAVERRLAVLNRTHLASP